MAFLSTLSLRRATRAANCQQRNHHISIHALLAESDTWQRGSRVTYVISIHALLAESDKVTNQREINQKNFYPRSPCGERHSERPETRRSYAISIHALLAESDLTQTDLANRAELFLSTLSLRRATLYPLETLIILPFLSTLSLRRATDSLTDDVSTGGNFYPRSPCGERRIGLVFLWWGVRFLSTLSLRRATLTSVVNSTGTMDFYPRSPCGERHDTSSLMQCQAKFLSTLSLRRATSKRLSNTLKHLYFYPRSPCGERQPGERHASSQQEFLSTLSLRRATSPASVTPAASRNFYPRSPCGERLESSYSQHVIRPSDFYPRSPCGERRILTHDSREIIKFLSTLSLRRATNRIVTVIQVHIIFLSTLSLRRATNGHETAPYRVSISIHALLAESDGKAARPATIPGISIHALLAESDSIHFLCTSK